MKQWRKRILSLAVSLVMLAALLSATILAAEDSIPPVEAGVEEPAAPTGERRPRPRTAGNQARGLPRLPAVKLPA